MLAPDAAKYFPLNDCDNGYDFSAWEQRNNVNDESNSVQPSFDLGSNVPSNETNSPPKSGQEESYNWAGDFLPAALPPLLGTHSDLTGVDLWDPNFGEIALSAWSALPVEYEYER